MQRHITNSSTNSATQQEQFDDGKELVEVALSTEDKNQNEAVDFVLLRIGSLSYEGEEESDETDYEMQFLSQCELYEIWEAFCYELYKVKVDLV